MDNVTFERSGSHREVDENYALLGCYETWSVNFLPTFRDR